VHLVRDALDGLVPGQPVDVGPALFVCTANSARSQLAAALWRQLTGEPAESAGTHPSDRVHPGAVAAAERAGLDLADAAPRALSSVATLPPVVVTVCDRAHEELPGSESWLHWSITDPVPVGTKAAFDAAVRDLQGRITTVLGSWQLAS
jgi:protein-tyrosine-phosphatase